MTYTQELKIGMLYYLFDYTAPKVFTGLYFECLITDQKIPAHAKVSIKTEIHIKNWGKEIYKPQRFNI